MINGLLIVLIGGISFFLTAALRQYALAQNLIDIPNARSSHSVPTPRGGGVSIVVAFLIALGALFWSGYSSLAFSSAAVGAGVLVAIIGFLDDHGHIAARWRLLGHFVAAGWALFWLNGLPPLQFFGAALDLGWFGNVLAAFYLVWMLNLYNFMDGIDGIASVEAISVCLGACLIYLLSGHSSLVWPALLMASAVAGFLYWNFPVARIFMGDAGSGFLGIMLAILSLQAAWTTPLLFWGWLILLGVFITDATFTLIRRLLRGDKVHQAHRSHAYQFASRRYGRHKPVTLVVGAINVLWLLPIAVAVTCFELDGLVGVILSYTPLLMLAIKFHAGELELPLSEK